MYLERMSKFADSMTWTETLSERHPGRLTCLLGLKMAPSLGSETAIETPAPDTLCLLTTQLSPVSNRMFLEERRKSSLSLQTIRNQWEVFCSRFRREKLLQRR